MLNTSIVPAVTGPWRRALAVLSVTAALLAAVVVLPAGADGVATISGRVTAEDTGLGLAGVYVYAESLSHDAGSAAFTDADGYYSMPEVPAGSYTVGFVDFGDVYIEEYWKDAHAEVDALVVVVGSDPVVGVDASMVRTGSEPSDPDPTIPDPTIPDPTVPDPTVPDPTIPDPTVPDPTVPDPTVPDPTVPDPTVPDPTVPDPTVPDPTVPDPTVPDPTVPDPTVPPGGGGGGGGAGGGGGGGGGGVVTPPVGEPGSPPLKVPPGLGRIERAVARLYIAYFARLPEPGGLAYWSALLRSGRLDLGGVSAWFASSHEFRSTYGALTTAGFVRLVYRNVLGRSPDPGGFAFWSTRLSSGLSRGQLMIGFSESVEFVRRTGG